jgi:hypothetical protein
VAAEESLARAVLSLRKTDGCCSWLSLSLSLALSLASLDPQMPMVACVCVCVCVLAGKRREGVLWGKIVRRISNNDYSGDRAIY